MTTKKSARFLSKVKAVAIDLDGVVYEGGELILGADRAVARLRSIGKDVFFLTNNSGKSRSEIADKLNILGVKAKPEEVWTSGYGAGIFLKNKKAKNVFVLGSSGLKNELAGLGLRVSDDIKSPYLLIGLDKEFDYQKITQGLRAALAGCVMVACNRDSNFPAEEGRLLPGCGAMVAAVEAAASRDVDYVIGKPETFLLRAISRCYGYRSGEIAVIGDVLGADIVMAKKFGSPSIYIGRSHRGNQSRVGIKPDFVAQSLVRAADLFMAGK